MNTEPMPETPLAAKEACITAANQILSLFDGPAYLRRAKAVESALDCLYRNCESQREQYLEGVRLRLRRWNQVQDLDRSGEGERHLREEYTCELNRLLLPDGDLIPAFGKPAHPSTAWEELLESVNRFNRRWRRYLHSISLARINSLIEDYNKNYLFEKECAIRSPSAARHGYEPLLTLDEETLRSQFPLLRRFCQS